MTLGLFPNHLILGFLVCKMEKIVVMRVKLDQAWKLLEQCLAHTRHSKFVISLLFVVATGRYYEAKEN